MAKTRSTPKPIPSPLLQDMRFVYENPQLREGQPESTLRLMDLYDQDGGKFIAQLNSLERAYSQEVSAWQRANAEAKNAKNLEVESRKPGALPEVDPGHLRIEELAEELLTECLRDLGKLE